MEVALLNLPLDNNYGGNLQRYALVSTLKKMGHNPVHISLRKDFKVPVWKVPLLLIRRAYQKYIRKMDVEIFYEWRNVSSYKEGLLNIMPFYDEYIPHTEPVYDISQLKKLKRYDAYIVGSDQVWRKSYTGKNLKWYYFSFVCQESPLLLAYAVSFGINRNEYLDKDVDTLKALYKRFKAVSVREHSGIDILKSIGFTHPLPIKLLDPTFLLEKDEYVSLFQKKGIQHENGRIFCYILDGNLEIEDEINRISHEQNLEPLYCYINKSKMTLEQWLCAMYFSDYVVTDSYHGLVFSIIFNKPYSLIRNARRGNARFDTLMDSFGLKEKNDTYDWPRINSIIEKKRREGILFLEENLK